MKIHWKGSIPCKNIRWFLENEHKILPTSLEEKREEIWNTVLTRHPDSYDGDILELRDFKVNEYRMDLYMNIIKFSRVLTLERLGEYLRPYGTIGMQMVVLSHNREYLLIGQRSSNSMYCPKYYSCPGGILELSDAKGTFERACLREFNEEVELALNKDLKLLAITSEINGTVGIVFLLMGSAKEILDMEQPICGNEEWEDKELRWYPLQALDKFSCSNSLESVVFAKENPDMLRNNLL
ncbi:MAG: NUDIX hydrolase [Candidatus Thorarchaeota archaeon]